MDCFCRLLTGEFERRFVESVYIGGGVEGTVRKVSDQNGMAYAVKIISLEKDGDKTPLNLVQLTETLRQSNKEAVRLEHVGSHPNIVGFFGANWFEEVKNIGQVSTTDVCGNSSTIQAIPPRTAVKSYLPDTTLTGAEASGFENSSVGQSASQEHVFDDSQSYNLYIQLELCQTTLHVWLQERRTLMNDSTYGPEFSQICSWVITPNHGSAADDLCLMVNHKDTNSCLEGIVRGLNHMHSKGYAHLDLHARNILMFINEHGVVIPKLCDFGRAQTLKKLHVGLLLMDQDQVNSKSEESIKTDPNSFDKDCKEDMQQLAEIMLMLYYPQVPELKSSSRQRLKTLGWAFTCVQKFKTFTDCFPQQAKWIELLKTEEYNSRPTAVEILRQGRESKMFNSIGLNEDIMETQNQLLQVGISRGDLRQISCPF